MTGPTARERRRCYAILRRAGRADRRRARRVDGGESGTSAHEPLVYRELTPLENLDLYGRLYRVPERRERIGMLLERFGLWEARTSATSTYSRGMTQRLARCASCSTTSHLSSSTSRTTRWTRPGAELLDAPLAELCGQRTLLVSTHDPDRVAPFATQRLALALRYPADVGALPRKDLLLELRAKRRCRRCSSSCFGVRRLPLRVARGSHRHATDGFLWIAILFAALLGSGRAFVPEREQRTMRWLVLAPCDRSAIWLAKACDACVSCRCRSRCAGRSTRSSSTRSAVAYGGLRSLLADVGICAVGTFLGRLRTRARLPVRPLLFRAIRPNQGDAHTRGRRIANRADEQIG